MDRRRAAGALFALAACFACSAAAPTASNQTSLDLYEGAPEGCYYNFQHYGEGDRIMTNEPCLNCTCHNRMLMCYLRVCPFTKAIGQDCTVEKRADQCCPIVTCPDVPVDLLTSTSTTSPAEYGATGLGKLDKYGCSISGKYFPEGSKVPPTPNKPCEHCYCIRNMTTCVMQECTLHVDGCTPIYHKDVCCPVRYSCDHLEDEMPLLDDMSTTVRPTPGFLLTTTTVSPVTQMTQDCVHDDQIFADGALIKTEKACEHCYCMKGDIVCVVQECGAPMENEGKNCTSLPPREGQCCPDTYICEGDELNSEMPTEATTETVLDKTTTLLPPRRVGVEGSGYRNEPDEAPYTAIPSTEPEVEGSGDDHDTSKPDYDGETIPPTEDGEQFISVTKAPIHDDHEVSSTETDKNIQDQTQEPHDTVATTMSSIEKVTDKEDEVTADLKPYEHYTTTSTEKTSSEYGEFLNTVPDEVHEDDGIKSHAETTTSEPSVETSESTSPVVEEDGTTVSSEKTEVVTAATSVSEYNTPTVTPEKEISDADKDISRTTVAKLDEYTEKTDSELDSSTSQPFIASSTYAPSEDNVKLTTEPDHAQNTVAVADDETSDSHIPSVTKVPEPFIEGEKTTVFNMEQPATDKTIIDEDSRPSEIVPTATTASPDGEYSTEEPDKGLNTIPNEVNEESTSAVPHLIDTKPTESDSQDVDIKQTTASETATLAPEIMVTKGDQYTVTTEPSFRKEDEISVSTKKPIDFISTTVRPEFVDEGLIPTSSHDEKLGSSSEVPSIEEDMTTSIPEYNKDMEETDDSKQTTPGLIPDVSVVTESEPTKHSEPSSDHDGEVLHSTEKPFETTAFVVEDGETHEEPSRIPGEGDCLLNGVTYRNNSVVPSTNNCHTGCRCASSIVKCDPIICSPPPDYMDNCQSIYDSPDSCCPTYVCDHPRETVPPQSDNQMSGTESPLVSPTIECRGDQCEITDHKSDLPHSVPSCENEADCKSVDIPTQEATSCEGDSCKKVDCAGDNCDPNAIFAPDHKNETPQDIPTQECNGEEPCRRKETSECNGPNCITEAKITAQDAVFTSTKSSIPMEAVTEKLEVVHEEKATEMPESSTKDSQEIDSYTTEKQLDTVVPSKDDVEKEPAVDEVETKKPIGIDDEVTEKPQDTDDADKETPIDSKETITDKPDFTDKDDKLKPTDAAEEITEKSTPSDDDKKETSAVVDDITEKPALSDEHGEFKPTTVGDIDEIKTDKPIDTQEIVTDAPTVTYDYEKESTPAIEEDITKQPALTDDDGKVRPPVINEDITEKPDHDDEVGKGKPTDAGEQVTVKPVLREDDDEIKPTLIDVEVTEAPVITDSDEKLKPTVMDEQITETPALTSEDGKEKITVIDEQVTKKPILPGDDEKETSDIVTDASVLTKEDEKVTSGMADEVTEIPVVPYEDDKTKPVIDEDVTGKPDMAYEDGKVKPTIIDEDITGKPDFIDEDGKVKPTYIDEDVTDKPGMADEDGKLKPTIIDEDVTGKPDMADEDSKVKPTITDDDVTGKPDTADEDGKVKPTIIDEDVTGKPDLADEDGKVKPTIIDEDVTGRPDMADEDDKLKPTIIDEDVTGKPDMADEDGKLKPTIIDEDVTGKPDMVDEDGKLKPTIIDEDVTGKPDIADEDGNIKPTITDEDVTGKPDMADEGGKTKPIDVEKDVTDKPDMADEDAKIKPTIVEEDVTGKPDLIDEDGKVGLTVVDTDVTGKPDMADDVVTGKPDMIDEDGKIKPTVVDEDVTGKPDMDDDDGKVKPTIIDEDVTGKPDTASEDGKIKPTVIDEDVTGKPDMSDADGKVKPTVIDEDVTDKPDLTDEDGRRKTTATEEEITEKPSLTDYEHEKVQPTMINEDTTGKPSEIDEDGKGKPTDTDEEITQKPAMIDDDKQTSALQDDVTEKPVLIVDDDKKETSAIMDEVTETPAQIDADGKMKPTVTDEDVSVKPADTQEKVTEIPAVTHDAETGSSAGYEEDVTMRPSQVDDDAESKPTDADDKITNIPATDDVITDKPAVIEVDDKEKQTAIEEQVTEEYSLTDEDVRIKPTDIDEKITDKPTLLEEDKIKSTISEEETTKKPHSVSDDDKVIPIDVAESTDETIAEVTKTPTTVNEDVSSTELPEIERTKPDIGSVTPAISVQPTDSTSELQEVTKMPHDEHSTTQVAEDVHAVSTVSNEPADESTLAPKDIEPSSETPSKSQPEHEATTMGLYETTPNVAITSDKESDKDNYGVTSSTQEVEEKPSTQASKLHDETESVEFTTKSTLGVQEETSTDIPDLELLTTSKQEDRPLEIEPQEGPADDKHKQSESGLMEDEMTTKMYEESSIKPVPESHVTDQAVAVTPESSDVTEHPEQPETQDDKKTTSETSESDKPKDEEKDKTVTETPVSSQDVSTEHQIPIETQKVSEESTPTTVKSYIPESGSTEQPDIAIEEDLEHSTQSQSSSDKPDNLTHATEEPIPDVTEPHSMFPSEKDETHDEKTSDSDVTDQIHKGTTPMEEYTQGQDATSAEEHSKAPDTYVTDEYATEIPESSTKLDGSKDSEIMPTEIPTTSEKVEQQTEPSPSYTESDDHGMKQSSVADTQEQSTKLPMFSEDSETERPEVLVTSETPQSLVTGHSETTISEKDSQEHELVTAQVQETTKTPELPVFVSLPEEHQTDAPIHVTKPSVEHDDKETDTESTEDINKVTKVSEAPVTEKQESLTTLRESSPSQDEATEKPQVDTKPLETTESQTETSETTPDLIILQEHTHKTVDVTTKLPSENEVTDVTSKVSPYEEHTEKVTEHIPSESPIDNERSTVYAETDHEYPELTTVKTPEIEIATKETDVDMKPSEETPIEVGVTEKVEDAVAIEKTTAATLEDNKYTSTHEEYTTSAPTQVSEETTPEAITEPAIVSVSETGILESSTKGPSATEKPTHDTAVPEDEIIFSTTKATTVRQEEEISDDKVAKPEDRPSETSEVPPTSTTAEVSKPSITDTQPTEKIPEPEEEFPSMGPNGYGEPDYVEEDQAFGPGTCRYGGKVYVSAQQIPRDDPCDFCFCFRSDIICLQQSCPPPIHGCHEEPIQGFCCPRYECPVSMATTVNVTTTTTTTTTTLPPHFPTHSYKGAAQRRGCQIKGHTYKVGEVVRSSSGPCLHCTCGGDGQMKCDPKACTPEPMLRQMIAAAVSAKRRR
ncbi:unnamed protein product [Chrysodeixis includens]|uniref:VWFC domain-containing protein n=1 Tax=Chrysodeixis includens TaxID=689277 RepID=A0A9P0C085_CHRIL|nr:unnamed protein product [Chrysodeixis includens]